MIPVESSHIRAIGYDFDAQRLHVEYKTDRTYTWDGVPPEKFAGLMAAESHGKYLNQEIRRRYSERVYEAAGPEQDAPIEDDFHAALERAIDKFHRDAKDALQ
jgi:hypothetical protein